MSRCLLSHRKWSFYQCLARPLGTLDPRLQAPSKVSLFRYKSTDGLPADWSSVFYVECKPHQRFVWAWLCQCHIIHTPSTYPKARQAHMGTEPQWKIPCQISLPYCNPTPLFNTSFRCQLEKALEAQSPWTDQNVSLEIRNQQHSNERKSASKNGHGWPILCAMWQWDWI